MHIGHDSLISKLFATVSMRAERWQQIDQLFHLALAQEPNSRASFLAQECGSDQSLRSEVEALIASHEQAQDFIESPASDLAAELLAKNQAEFVPGQSIGPYEILSALGTGGMGEVYLAHDTRLGRQVALKLLPAQFIISADRLRRFEQEARAVSALNHPNIVTIHEINRIDDAHFIVTEFIDGQTLRRRIDDPGMNIREALDVAIQVTSALNAAHVTGIVHRDIKPENIMVRRDGYVKVLDFGLAKLTEGTTFSVDSEATEVKTNPGMVLGTVAYMSPEQARGLPVDARTDVFSVGVVLYETISGRAPFEGETPSDVVVAILREEPVPLREYSQDVPIELEWIVKKALSKDRDERYQTIKELQIDLRRLKQELELQVKLEGLNPSKRLDQGITQRNNGVAVDNSTRAVTRTASTAESLVGNIKRRPRWAIGRGLLAVAIPAVAIFSLISFYAGTKQAPTPSLPTFRQLTFRRGAVTGARFAPDGNTIVYSAAFDGKPVELFTSHLESPESRSLDQPAGIQSISSTGEMAILLNCEVDMFGCHNGTLARLPLVGGTPRELRENVYLADWGPDGQELAIVHDDHNGQYQLEYPIGKVLYKAPGRIGAIRVSPKGDMVALIDNPILGDMGGSIMIVDRNGEKRTLSSGWKSIADLAWSPTGDEIWFSAGKGTGNLLNAVALSGHERLIYTAPGNIGLKDISRNGRVLLQRGIPRSRMMSFTTGFEKERDLAWFDGSISADISSDGKNLLFYDSSTAVGGVPFVYLRKLDGSNEPVQLGPGKAFALSPDGKWALAVQEGSSPKLVLLSTGPGAPRVLPRGVINEVYLASWFHDGKRILVTGIVEAGRGMRSYIQDISGGEPQPITEEGTFALSVSPDGQRFIAWAPDQGPDGKYYLSAIDGTSHTSIPGLEIGDIPIQWSSDGRALYVRGFGDSTSAIYRVDLLSGRRELRTEIVPDQVGLIGFDTPFGVQITPDGKSYVYTYWTALRDLFLAEGLK